MKKKISLLLAIVLVLVGCSGKEEVSDLIIRPDYENFHRDSFDQTGLILDAGGKMFFMKMGALFIYDLNEEKILEAVDFKSEFPEEDIVHKLYYPSKDLKTVYLSMMNQKGEEKNYQYKLEDKVLYRLDMSLDEIKEKAYQGRYLYDQIDLCSLGLNDHKDYTFTRAGTDKTYSPFINFDARKFHKDTTIPENW